MENDMSISPVACFHSPFKSKFGVPKQSGLVDELEGYIEFLPEFRDRDMLRGIEGFDYLWLIWHFSANPHKAASPLVRPPLLGGNKKVGVFASRSPFRPNALGLSSVRLDHVDYDSKKGPLVYVRGADLMDGTPIYDIKPYVSLSDAHSDAHCGFVDSNEIHRLEVVVPEGIEKLFQERELVALKNALALDPRPHYQDNAEKVYGMPFMDYDVKFQVCRSRLLVIGVDKTMNV